MVAEKGFRRLNAPHLLTEVYEGIKYVDGTKESNLVVNEVNLSGRRAA